MYIPALDSGGPDRVFAELAKGFSEKGNQVVLLCDRAGGRIWDQIDSGIELKSLDRYSNRRRSYDYRSFRVAIKETQPDIVLCTLSSILTATIARIVGKNTVPLVFRPANHLSKNAKELLKSAPLKHSLSWGANVMSLHMCDHLVCQSQDLFDDFRRYRVPVEKMSVIGNPVQLAAEYRSSGMSANKEKVNLVAIGRLSDQKGFDVLIKAIAIVRKKLPSVQLSILGSGPEEYRLRDLIRRLELESIVSLKGFTADVARYIREADFLVSSSRYEGFPNAVLESIAHGTPVIATDCPGGTRDMVVEGLTGSLCSPDSADALAEAVYRTITGPPFSPELIRKFTEEHFSVSKIVDQYIHTFKIVLNNYKS